MSLSYSHLWTEDVFGVASRDEGENMETCKTDLFHFSFPFENVLTEGSKVVRIQIPYLN